MTLHRSDELSAGGFRFHKGRSFEEEKVISTAAVQGPTARVRHATISQVETRPAPSDLHGRICIPAHLIMLE